MRKNILVSLALLAIVGCATTPATTDYDPSVQFGNYKTFAFISDRPLLRAEGAETGSPLLEGRLMQISGNILSARGFTRVSDRGSADIAIAFTVGGREKIQINSYPEPYRAHYNSWGRRGAWGGSYYSTPRSQSVRQYTEGTLLIDIYDVAQHKPVWHGSATKRITKKMRENPEETINEIVMNILATFPPN
jgi:hypothetical protein